MKSEEEGADKGRPLRQKVDAQTLRPLPRNKENIYAWDMRWILNKIHRLRPPVSPSARTNFTNFYLLVNETLLF